MSGWPGGGLAVGVGNEDETGFATAVAMLEDVGSKPGQFNEGTRKAVGKRSS